MLSGDCHSLDDGNCLFQRLAFARNHKIICRRIELAKLRRLRGTCAIDAVAMRRLPSALRPLFLNVRKCLTTIRLSYDVSSLSPPP
jgi:hypothetical protein